MLSHLCIQTFVGKLPATPDQRQQPILSGLGPAKLALVFLRASQRSIVSMTAVTAASRVRCRPDSLVLLSKSTVHIRACSPISWTTVYSVPRYSIRKLDQKNWFQFIHTTATGRRGQQLTHESRPGGVLSFPKRLNRSSVCASPNDLTA